MVKDALEAAAPLASEILRCGKGHDVDTERLMNRRLDVGIDSAGAGRRIGSDTNVQWAMTDGEGTLSC